LRPQFYRGRRGRGFIATGRSFDRVACGVWMTDGVQILVHFARLFPLAVVFDAHCLNGIAKLADLVAKFADRGFGGRILRPSGREQRRDK
jgi:hypothetical protein